MLNIVLENIAQAMVIVGPDSRIIAANRRMVELFGLAPAFFTHGTHFHETLREWARATGQDDAMLEKAIAETFLRDAFTFEFQQTVNGQSIWCQLHHNPLPDGGFVRTFTDITDLKETEQKLRDSKKLLEKIFASLNESIFIVKTGSRIISDCNKTVEKMFGYKRDEMIGNHTSCLHVSEEMSLRFASEMLAAYETHGFYETSFKMKRKDGTVFDSEHSVTPVRDSSGEVVSHVCVVRDITERKQMELHQAKSEQEFRWICEQALVGVAVAAPDSRIIKANRKLCEMLGYSEEELLSKTISDITHPDDRELSKRYAVAALSLQTTGFDFEKRYISKKGTAVWVNVHVTLIRDESGAPINFMGIVLDISARKHAETSMAEYQNQLKTLANELSLAEERERRRLAVGLHDQIIQNLAIAKINLTSRIGKEQNAECFIVHEKLGSILDEVIHDSRRLVFDLSPPLLYDLGLGAAIEELGARMGSEHGFNFEFSECGNEADIDEVLQVGLYQMIRELLFNVVKHAQATTVKVAIANSDGVVTVTVQDDGVGIAPERVPELYKSQDAFGLFSIQQRITSLGGSFSIEAPGKSGTTICLKVPVRKGEC